MPLLSARFRMAGNVLTAFVATLCMVTASLAQAGRHIPKTPQPDPVPAAPPVQPSEPKPRPKPSFVLKVVADLPLSVYQIFPKPEYMPEWATERLRTSLLLDVRDAGSANRRDAIKLAKSETEAYVTWLQLRDDPFITSTNLPAAGGLEVNYEIFFPVSGKTKALGRVTLNQASENGRASSPTTVIRSCHTGIYGRDFILLQASLEAAERVMNAFNIPIPPDCRQRSPGI